MGHARQDRLPPPSRRAGWREDCLPAWYHLGRRAEDACLPSSLQGRDGERGGGRAGLLPLCFLFLSSFLVRRLRTCSIGRRKGTATAEAGGRGELLHASWQLAGRPETAVLSCVVFPTCWGAERKEACPGRKGHFHSSPHLQTYSLIVEHKTWKDEQAGRQETSERGRTDSGGRANWAGGRGREGVQGDWRVETPCLGRQEACRVAWQTFSPYAWLAGRHLACHRPPFREDSLPNYVPASCQGRGRLPQQGNIYGGRQASALPYMGIRQATCWAGKRHAKTGT